MKCSYCQNNHNPVLDAESQEPYVLSQDTAPAVLSQLKSGGVFKNE